VYALRQVEGGKKVSEICLRDSRGWDSATCGSCVNCGKKTGKLKTLVANLTLDQHILQKVPSKRVDFLVYRLPRGLGLRDGVPDGGVNHLVAEPDPPALGYGFSHRSDQSGGWPARV
jgi:hypothetical protein